MNDEKKGEQATKGHNLRVSAQPEYGANEQQREAILNWVKNERLVFFLQTKYPRFIFLSVFLVRFRFRF